MAIVLAANPGEVSPLLSLPINENGPIDRIFSYVGIQGLGALSSVCRQIHFLVVDSGERSRGRLFWQGAIEAEMAEAFRQVPKRWSVIDKHVWEDSPMLSQFLKDQGLKMPDRLAHHCYYKTVFLGLRALNSLEIEKNAGRTYIELPQGITSRMLCGLLAQAMGKAKSLGYMSEKFPREYLDHPVRKFYAFGISNAVVEGSRDCSHQVKRKIELLRNNRCEMPEGIEQISLLALTYVLTKEQLGKGVFLYSNLPARYSSAWVNDQDFEIGCFSTDGIDIYKGYTGWGNDGVGAVRRFLPIIPELS